MDGLETAAGLAVLVIEDEPLISMHLEAMLEDLGCYQRGPCATLESAIAAVASHDFDVALVDLHLGSSSSDSVVAELQARGIPFAVVTGDGFFQAENPTAVVLQKPFDFSSFAGTMEQLAIAAQGSNSSPADV